MHGIRAFREGMSKILVRGDCRVLSIASDNEPNQASGHKCDGVRLVCFIVATPATASLRTSAKGAIIVSCMCAVV
jgi:hypothetical protein